MFQILLVWFPTTRDRYFDGASVSHCGRKTCRCSADNYSRRRHPKISVMSLSRWNKGKYFWYSNTLLIVYKFKFESINIREGYWKRISCISQSIFLRKRTTSPHIYVNASQSFPVKFEMFIGGDNNGFWVNWVLIF